MGISLAAPPNPKVKLQSLPTMLRIQNNIPMRTCSKAPRVFPSCRR